MDEKVFSIRVANLADSESISRIYNHYIEHTVITFEEQVVDQDEIARRIGEIQGKNYPYIVCESANNVVGYAYLNNWRVRSAYNITLESSIYVDKDYIGQGIGLELYVELLMRAKTLGLHSVIGSISLPNDVSRYLHKKLGFVLVGNFREAGLKFGKLVDVEFWQLFL